MMINWYEVYIFFKLTKFKGNIMSYKTLVIHIQIKFSHEIISIYISNMIWNLIFIYWKHGYFLTSLTSHNVLPNILTTHDILFWTPRYLKNKKVGPFQCFPMSFLKCFPMALNTFHGLKKIYNIFFTLVTPRSLDSCFKT
jgi:hypothetical protein